MVDRWLVVHVLQLILFGLMGLAAYLLVGEARGVAATVSGVSIGVFVVFDTLAGIATGILVQSASSLTAGEQVGVEKATQALFDAAEIVSLAVFKIIGELG